jgi:hypothetical protein
MVNIASYFKKWFHKHLITYLADTTFTILLLKTKFEIFIRLKTCFWKFDITYLILIMHPRRFDLSLFAFLASPKSNMRMHKCIVLQTKKGIDEWHEEKINLICKLY